MKIIRIGDHKYNPERYSCAVHGTNTLEYTIKIKDQITKNNVVHKIGLKGSECEQWNRITNGMNEEYEHYLMLCAAYCKYI